MANYDTPGLTYDSGVLYDAPAPPFPRRKTMAKVKLTLDRLADAQVIQHCTNIKTAMTGNANFATPTPTLTALGTLITAATTKLTTAENAQTAAKQATADKDVALDALRAAAAQLATYVDLIANGDESKILSAGMAVRAPRTPAGVPPTVMNLFLTAGDNAGTLDLQWDPLPEARTYEIELSPDPVTGTSWSSRPSVTKSKALVTGLTSGSRQWARVRAVNAAGQGAWSDPATKIVP